jgi:hypothetical protein
MRRLCNRRIAVAVVVAGVVVLRLRVGVLLAVRVLRIISTG